VQVSRFCNINRAMQTPPRDTESSGLTRDETNSAMRHRGCLRIDMAVSEQRPRGCLRLQRIVGDGR
jgi:hypothetical protein